MNKVFIVRRLSGDGPDIAGVFESSEWADLIINLALKLDYGQYDKAELELNRLLFPSQTEEISLNSSIEH